MSQTLVWVLNGPNLNLLGLREPDVYGKTTLEDIQAELEEEVKKNYPYLKLDFFQTNREYEMIEKVHTVREEHVRFVIINPGAWTHTSVALRDAFLAVEVPLIEVHLSNVHKREEFRRHSYLSDIATGVICGLNSHGYMSALRYVAKKFEPRATNNLI